MKKYKNMFNFIVFSLLLGSLGAICAFFKNDGKEAVIMIGGVVCVITLLLVCGIIFFIKKKDNINKVIAKLLVVGNIIFATVIAGVCALSIIVLGCTDKGDFSLSTSLFVNKKIMIIVPHQDDDINLMGGLIEQYAENNSEITVVFTTNGDYNGKGESRAAEAISVLTSLGVSKDNVYYLGFGDQWTPQVFDGQKIQHIYNSPDPDAIWQSHYGVTSTYGTKSINCYMELPYTRNNFLLSIQTIIQEKMPDIIFAVDFDQHIDHKASSLLFEEAMCNLLTLYPDYQPTVYKGFCYGTAWSAEDDFYSSINLLSTQRPTAEIWDNTTFGYVWEERVRLPMDSANLSIILSNNSVYQSLEGYFTPRAYNHATKILNGDKVFWERRTDSLLYDAEISVNGNKSFIMNDFKLTDFYDISQNSCVSVGVEHLKNKTVHIALDEAVTANCMYFYDNPSESDNIIEGYVLFSDGSKINFDALQENGAATKITFPDKQIQWLEIVPTKTEGECFGLSEVEMYYDTTDTQKKHDIYLMAIDHEDNFVYDYIIPNGDTVKLRICSFPHTQTLNKEEVQIDFQSTEETASYSWEDNTLVVKCAKGNTCKITVSSGDACTTFTVSNPSIIKRAWLTALRSCEPFALNVKSFVRKLCAIF